MASDEDTVKNIAYLSQYIEESHGRVTTLEEALENTRQESTARLNALNGKVRRSESEKSALQKEVLVLRDTLRVKQERVSDLGHEAENISLRTEIAALQDRLKAESSVDVAQLQSKTAVLKEETVRLREELRLTTERCAQLPRLESDNASLRHEVVGLQHALKVKQEPPLDVRLSEPRVAEVQRALDDERLQKETLQIKCTSLYAQVKQSADLAAKTLRERVDSLKELAKMRIESGKLKDDVERVQRMCDELTGANAAGNAERAALIEANDAALTALKTENAALTEQLSASSAKTLKAKTKYKKAKADKDALQQMLNDSTNSPHAEEHMHFDSTAMPEDPGELDDYTPGNDPEEDNSDDDDGKTEVVVERQGAVSVEAAMDQYRKHFDALGRPSGYTLPAASELVVFDTAKAYAKAADTNSSSSNHSFLYMPGRTTQMRRGHYAVFGPTHRYDWAAGVWIDSDLDVLYGTTQELFVPAKKSKIKYMGSYECQDLRNLSPAGIICPDAINTRAIEDVALGAPRPPNFEAIIQQRYPDGVIKVHAMGLRFIEFNYKLYDSLRRNKKGDRGCKSTPVIRKRKAEDEVVVGHRYGLRKRQKTEESPA